MFIADTVVEDMLRNIDRPEIRDIYGKIVHGYSTHAVKCVSASCRGRIIAYVNADGTVTETPPVYSKKKDKIYRSGLEGHRYRLDGHLGFRCYCGNSSILAEEEKGVISSQQPTDEDLNTVAKRLHNSGRLEKSTNDDIIEIDGFIKERIK